MRQMCSPSIIAFRPPPASSTPGALNHTLSIMLHDTGDANTHLIKAVLQAQLSVPALLLLQQQPPARHPARPLAQAQRP